MEVVGDGGDHHKRVFVLRSYCCVHYKIVVAVVVVAGDRKVDFGSVVVVACVVTVDLLTTLANSRRLQGTKGWKGLVWKGGWRGRGDVRLG